MPCLFPTTLEHFVLKTQQKRLNFTTSYNIRMDLNTAHDLEDLENFYHTNYPQPIRTMEPLIKILPYHIPSFADMSSSRSTYCCIGKKGHGTLANPCKAVLPHDTRPAIDPNPRVLPNRGNIWAEAETLVKLAKSYLCEDCCTTQLSDVVVAWIKEIESPVERVRCRADSVVDCEGAIGSQGTDIAPVRSLVAASVATREVFSKVFGFWSGSGRTLYH
jgi:hypothetical protein